VHVLFPLFNIIRDNIGHSLSNINYFSVQDMLDNAKISFNSVAKDGAVIIVQVNWDCNFDKSENLCEPKFSFLRIDDPDNPFSAGFNYRYTHNYWINTNESELVEYRDLIKVNGLRFLVLVSGFGGKFDVVPMFVNLGSGLALLSVATVVSDIIALYLLPKRKFYHEAKYQDVNSGQDRSIVDERSPLKLSTHT